MAKNIEAFRLQTRIEVDNAKGRVALQTIEKDVDKVGARFTKLGPEITKAMKGTEAGGRFGKDFGSAATSVITGSINSLGQTIGALLGTAMAPGVGTAVGSTIGSAIDSVAGKVTGMITPLIERGIDLNEQIERANLYFKTYLGSQEAAEEHMKVLTKLSRDAFDLPTMIKASQRFEEFTGDVKLTELALQAASDKAAAFGGDAEVFDLIINKLGVMVETGKLATKDLKALAKKGVDVTGLLAEGYGLSRKKIELLMEQGRIRGEGAARVIAEGIERHQGGYAAKVSSETGFGRKHQFEALLGERAVEGTKAITEEMSKFYAAADDVLAGPAAKSFVAHLDATAAKLIDLVEKGLSSGLNLVQGVGTGVTSGKAITALDTAFGTLKGAAEKGLKKVFEIQSPSEFSARVAGIPLGEGIAAGILPGFLLAFDRDVAPKLNEEIERLIRENAKKWNVPEQLIRAVMGQESRGHPGAVSPKGARGLMQLMPGTAKRFGVTNPHDPAQSISGGTQYLKFLSDMFGGNLDLVLAGYNAGEGAVQKYGNKIPPYAETQNYVRQIKGRLSGNAAMLPQTQSGPSTADVWSNPAQLKKVMDSFSPEELQQVAQLGTTIKQTMDEMARIDVLLRAAQTELAKASKPEGYDVNRESRASVLVQDLSSRQDKLRESLGQLNLENQQLIQSTVSLHLAQQEAARRLAEENSLFLPAGARQNPDVPEAHAFTTNIDDMVAPLKAAANAADFFTNAVTKTHVDITETVPPLTAAEAALIASQAMLGRGTVALTATMQASARQMDIAGVSLVSQLSGALAQASGFLPQQQVGKKRGLFGKILGFAAPFLNFIPGVGPILSQIAGIASQGLAGNWAGAAAGIAGGFGAGGAFRGSGASGSGTVHTHPVIHRAGGGPVRRGRNYIVGEEGPEPFVPYTDGFIFPHGSRVSASRSGGGDSDHPIMDHLPRLLAVLERQEAALTRLEAVPPGHIVQQGIRERPHVVGAGLVRAMDHDAAVIRSVGQRLRLS